MHDGVDRVVACMVVLSLPLSMRDGGGMVDTVVAVVVAVSCCWQRINCP